MNKDDVAKLAKKLEGTPPPEISIRKAIDELLPHIKRLVSQGHSQRQIAVMLQERIKASENTLRSYIATALWKDGKRADSPGRKRGRKSIKKK